MLKQNRNPANIHRVPRYWSNQELAIFAHHFTGKVINVSAWKDEDRQGRHYEDYFINAEDYWISNYKDNMRGVQGVDNELFLNLEEQTPEHLIDSFDVVFNHTTLEHIYNINSAFDTLTELTKDIVILVVPFLQQVHVIPEPENNYDNEYSDYWRFTPHVLERLFNDRGMKIAYLNFNKHKRTSVYIFCIATKKPEKWQHVLPMGYSNIDFSANYRNQPWAGCNAFRQPFLIEFIIEISNYIYNKFSWILKQIKKIERRLKLH